MPEQDWDNRARASDADDALDLDAPAEVSVRWDVEQPSISVLFVPRTESQQ